MSDGREVLVRCRVEDDGTESVEMQTEGPLVVLVGGPNQIRIGHRYVAPGWLAAQTEPT